MTLDRMTASREELNALRVHDSINVGSMPIDAAENLTQVLDEIVDLMGARSVMVTIHNVTETIPRIVHADRHVPEQGRNAILQYLSGQGHRNIRDDESDWREVSGRPGTVLMMPVTRTEGHSRLIISVFFDNPDPQQRIEAERLYQERRPFAIGFFRLWQRTRILQQRVQSFESALNQTAIGVVMIDRDSHIVFSNQTADEILMAGEGIGCANGTLRAANLADGVNLQAAISHAVASDDERASRAPFKAPLIAFSRRRRPPLVAAFLPALARPVEAGDVAAIMYLVDPQIDTNRMLSPLCKLYGLSPVETVLVCHLAAGATIASAARQMHVKDSTARSYLKTIFIKTGTRRQTELVVLMLSSLIRTKRDVLPEALTFIDSERALGIRA
jgi:DNA-binding CsgD family transcriptional regulator